MYCGPQETGQNPLLVFLLTLSVWSTGKEVLLRHALTSWQETAGWVTSVQTFPDNLGTFPKQIEAKIQQEGLAQTEAEAARN